MAEERGEKPDVVVKPEYDEDPYKDSIDKLPVKGKKKWRLF